MLSDTYGELADRLRAIADDLDDLAFDRLREAVADGELVRPADDKLLMQARRAIDKAATILGQLAGGPDGTSASSSSPT